ncbi:MAG TPA: hypothetical protein VIM14_13890, partial [Polyangia bacterium]
REPCLRGCVLHVSEAAPVGAAVGIGRVETSSLNVDPAAGEVELVIHWKGGVHTRLCVRRRRTGENSNHTSKDVVEAVRVLACVCTDETLAGVLNRNGLYTGHGNRWTKQLVTSLRSKHAIPVFRLERQQQEGWMKLGEAAGHAGISETSLRSAVEHGDIEALHPLPLHCRDPARFPDAQKPRSK